MNPAELEGKSYGPANWRVAEDAVADFIHITGDDPARWSEHAPPGFAAAALFAVAPDLLAELYDHSIVHGEQSFTWNQPLAVDSQLEVDGSVTRVRDRGGVSFITFEMEARQGSDVALTGKSLFLVSGEAIAGGRPEFVRPEPHHSYRGDPAEGQLAASRDDLVRYASATMESGHGSRRRIPWRGGSWTAPGRLGSPGRISRNHRAPSLRVGQVQVPQPAATGPTRDSGCRIQGWFARGRDLRRGPRIPHRHGGAGR